MIVEFFKKVLDRLVMQIFLALRDLVLIFKWMDDTMNCRCLISCEIL